MTRRDDIRLGVAVVPRRSSRTVRRHDVVASGRRVLRIGGADANRRRRIARRSDSGVTRQPGYLIFPDVPRRGDNDKAGGGRLLDGLHQGVVCRGRPNGMPERHVDNLNVQLRFVRGDELKGGDDIARVSGAGAIEHLEADEPDRGSDALKRVIRQNAAAADQPGDVGAVAVVVVGRDGCATSTIREVIEAGDPAAEIAARRDARIDDGDADARSPAHRRRRDTRQSQRLTQCRPQHRQRGESRRDVGRERSAEECTPIAAKRGSPSASWCARTGPSSESALTILFFASSSTVAVSSSATSRSSEACSDLILSPCFNSALRTVAR